MRMEREGGDREREEEEGWGEGREVSGEGKERGE